MNSELDVTDEKLLEMSRKIDDVIMKCLEEGLSVNATNGVFLARLMIFNRETMNQENFLKFIEDVLKKENTTEVKNLH
jgi:hypothetical protein